MNNAVFEVVAEIKEFIDEIKDAGTNTEWETEILNITAREAANNIVVKKRLEEVPSAEVV